MKTLCVILLFRLSLAVHAADAGPWSDDRLLRIQFEQKINAQVSLSLVFTNEVGRAVALGDYLGRRPVVLMLGYYGCPMLCTLLLNGATEDFRNLKGDIGREFDVIFVSIDPRESTALAAAKKQSYVHSYHRAGTENGWHFLTGGPSAISTLADEVGFRYAYDPVSKQFAHPSGLVILTPEGKVSRYFLGVTYSASQLDAALRTAAAEQSGPAASPLFLLCFHYSPVAGKYGPLVLYLVRGAGVAMAIVLGIVILAPGRKAGGGR